MALNVQQRLFVEKYMLLFNATAAAIESGYSEKTAYSQGARLLNHVEIKEAISERLRESAMSADEVLMRLAKQARGDIRDYLAVGDDGVDVDLKYAIEAQKTDLIKKLTHKKTVRTDKDDNTTEEAYIQIEMYDAQSALQLIGKHHALFIDKSEVRNYDIDLSKLSDDQLDRVASGEDVMKVIVDGYIASNQGTS